MPSSSAGTRTRGRATARDRAAAAQEALRERTTRGWVAWLNDLHKGRDTGPVWYWFIDVFAGVCIVFCLTGLVLLQFHASKRPSTWPLVGFGFRRGRHKISED